jgi:hypothetical protein
MASINPATAPNTVLINRAAVTLSAAFRFPGLLPYFDRRPIQKA